MSKNVVENTGEKKVMTKYDLKMQKREEERKKAKQDELIGRIAGIAITVVIFCLVASFPLRSWLTVNGTYIEVAGEKVTRVEFDYNYNQIKNSYIAQNGYYMSLFGMDLSGDLSTQMYSDTLSFQDYFEQLTAESIAQNKALRDEMRKAGFVYDTSEEYAKYRQDLTKAAEEADMTEKAYLQQTCGTYATESRLKGYVTEMMETAAYYKKIAEEKTPSDADISEYYAGNMDSYDSVDYYLLTVNAELPTEPTDLADPQEENQDAAGTDTDANTDAAGTDTDADTAYTPSEAEVAFAMSEAKKEAEAALKDLTAKGDLNENQRKSATPISISEWLFDSARKAGDNTVIENAGSNLYYAVEFKERRLDQTPTVDARIITVAAGAEVSAVAILEEWNNSGATQESFALLADKYGASVEGGLYEGLSGEGMDQALTDWLFDSARTSGEAAVIVGSSGTDETGTATDGSSYVVWFAGQNMPVWFLRIKNTLLTERMTAYIEEISKGYEVTDGKGRLKYLEIPESGASESESPESGASGSESTGSEASSQDGGTSSQN